MFWIDQNPSELAAKTTIVGSLLKSLNLLTGKLEKILFIYSPYHDLNYVESREKVKMDHLTVRPLCLIISK